MAGRRGWLAALSCVAALRPFDTQVRVATTCSVRLPRGAPREPSLTEYMRLPTAQYALLDLPYGASLERLGPGDDGDVEAAAAAAAEGADLFLLKVPPVQFFFLRVEPNVYATVEARDESVVVESSRCLLLGSDALIERIGLNEAFEFTVRATMTWTDDGAADARTIDCDTSLAVDVAPPGPFRAMPKAILERTGNAVMRVATDQVLRGFLRTLVQDYDLWGSDAAYRERRAKDVRSP